MYIYIYSYIYISNPLVGENIIYIYKQCLISGNSFCDVLCAHLLATSNDFLPIYM